MFDGHILNWRCFLEQFVVSIHDHPNEKQIFNCTIGSAKSAIEDLSQSGNNYKEAIKCLKERYDRPRLINQAHVKAILEAARLRTETEKKLRKLYDIIQQHLRALKGMSYEPSGPSTVELKLDQNTMFE